MRRLSVLMGTVVLALAPLPTFGVTQPDELAVIFEIEAGYSGPALDAMKSELASIMAPTGAVIRFKRLSDVATSDRFVEVVVVRFRGRCRVDGPPVQVRWGNSLASTHSSDGEVLPFVDVECDRIRDVIHDSVRRWSGDVDRLLGRAWARVLAHELYHVRANTARHGDGGIAQARLSPRELLSESLRFDAEDVEKMRAPAAKRAAVAGGG